MQSIKSLQRYIIFLTLFALLMDAPHPVSAQQPQTITATGTMSAEGGKALPLTMTFPPAGGDVTGIVDYSYEWSPTDVSCSGIVQIDLEGKFAGGDGGAVTGAGSGTGEVGCDDGSSVTVKYNGPWSGNYYADGTGDGVFDLTGYIGSHEGSVQATWQVSFPASEFQSMSAPSVTEETSTEPAPSIITSEYIYNTYGITIEDSFGDDQWERKLWSDQELALLNDVLKELPPELIKTMAVTRIVRNKIYIDPNGNQKPNTYGVYSPCDRHIDPDCTGSSATIRIFDNALKPLDFTDDPDGYKEFKGTILHELTHALQYHKDQDSTYKNPNSSPLVENYMDATRPITDMNSPGFWASNGWMLDHNSWKLTTAPDNQPPTNYSKKNPLEDMSESVMLYMYEPRKLQTSSIKRYNFIRDQIFGGAEYENGIRK